MEPLAVARLESTAREAHQCGWDGALPLLPAACCNSASASAFVVTLGKEWVGELASIAVGAEFERHQGSVMG